MRSTKWFSVFFLLLTGCLCLFVMVGCTSTSTLVAQKASLRTQAVKDGVFYDTFNALSRENFETARLKLQKAVEAQDQPAAEAILVELATKRDRQLEWSQDFERANAYKYVTVDMKLYSDIGILNYLGGKFSEATKKVLEAVDEAAANKP